MNPDMWIYPEDVKCWVDGVGWVPQTAIEVDLGKKVITFKKTLPKGKQLDHPLVEIIYDHELMFYDKLGLEEDFVTYSVVVDKP